MSQRDATPNHDTRLLLLNAAWRAALGLYHCDDRPDGDPGDARRRFLRRKPCHLLAPSECEAAWHLAVGIVQASHSFRRSRCGTLPPRASRRYELHHALALQLETDFPEATPLLVARGCQLLKSYWDR